MNYLNQQIALTMSTMFKQCKHSEELFKVKDKPK